MGALLCPTVVLCMEATGLALGERLAGTLRENYSASPVAVWAISHDESEYTLAPITPAESPGSTPLAQLSGGSTSEIVAEVIAASLSLGDSRIPTVTEGPTNLRLALIGSPYEIQASLLSDLAASLHNSAQRHCGPHYLVEAYFLLRDLPDRITNAAAPLEELLQSIDASASAGSSSVANNLFSYCWWLGRVNVLGLALPPFSDSMDELTAVVLGVLTTPLEHLPTSVSLLSGQPQHMSAGYGELFVPREKLFEYLKARHICRLLRSMFLDRGDDVDPQAVQKLVWEFSLSPEGAGLLAEVELTAGGERIWKGFHPDIPPEVFAGEVDEFLRDLHEESRQFFSDLKKRRSEFELSGRVRREEFLNVLESKVHDLVERSRGGLFEARAFLEEMQSLLLETADVAEGEKAMNLQEIRRQFDHAFAEAIRVNSSRSAEQHQSKVKELRRQLDRLTRLRNIFSEPALDATILEVLRWNATGDSGDTLEESIAETMGQLQTEVTAWGQAIAGAEQAFQYARYAVEPEIARRETEIRKAENSLCDNAAECRRLRLELELAHDNLQRKWFRVARRDHSLKQKNERLKHLESVLLKQQAREVVRTHASRMQLSIDCIVYDVRSRIIHSALEQVRLLHQKITRAIETLTAIYESFANAEPPAIDHLLRRSLVSAPNLEILLEHLTRSLPAVSLAHCPSAWEVCCQPAEKTAAQLEQAAAKPLLVMLEWMLDDFLLLLKVPNRELEALITWLRNASQPLFRPGSERMFKCSIVRLSDNSEVARIVRHTFPEAAWLEPSTTPSLSVLQFAIMNCGVSERLPANSSNETFSTQDPDTTGPTHIQQ
jgi:hypothetical protein